MTETLTAGVDEKTKRLAAEHDARQAEVKKVMGEIRAANEAEKRRVLAWKDSQKALAKRLSDAQAKANASAVAREKIRQTVPVEVRQAVKEAAREERKAAQVVERMSEDLRRGRDSVLEVKDRARKVPVEAASKDVREAIKRAEAAQVARESDLTVAKETHEAAKARRVAATQAYEAALAAARAL